MAKQEVLDAINATIAPNGIKGITADSLRNVLTLMAENTGSGTGEGALRVMIPMVDFFTDGGIEFDFTPEVWETMKGVPDISATGLAAMLDPVVEELFRHNAEVYAQIMEKAVNNEGVMCLIDVSAFAKVVLETLLPLEGVEASIPALSVSGASIAMVMEVEPAEIASSLGIPIGLNIIPLSKEYTGMISPYTSVELRADGSVRMHIDGTWVDSIYVPSDDAAVLTENQKAINARWKQNGTADTIKEVMLCYSTSDGNYTDYGTRVLYVEVGVVRYFQYEDDVTYLKQATIAEDGSATVTTLGVINPPTA